MKIKYNIALNSTTYYVSIDEPAECPICKHSLKPSILHKELIFDNNDKINLYVTYLCTHCYKPFICQFTQFDKEPNKQHSYVSDNLSLIEPNTFQKRSFDVCIKEISPDFVDIYNQAFEAEHRHLDQISGIGYRKALEFLIKDFLIKHEHKEIEKVNPTALGTCINTMIDNPQLKTVASRATWLGNDQTHYEQKYQDKDIADLKRLIDLSVHWITMICLTDEAESIEKK